MKSQACLKMWELFPQTHLQHKEVVIMIRLDTDTIDIINRILANNNDVLIKYRQTQKEFIVIEQKNSVKCKIKDET